MVIFQLVVLFVLGCLAGWLYEFIFWSILKRKIYNPGFLSGPYLPVYGFGVIILFFIGMLDFNFLTKVVLFMVLATILEMFTGLLYIYYNKARLWDYSKNLFNFKGVISIKYSLGWGFFGALFFYFVYPNLFLLERLNNFYFITILIIFYIVFILDAISSFRLFRNIRVYIIMINKKNHTHKILNYLFYKGKFMKKKSMGNFLMPLQKLDDNALYKDLERYMKHND